MGEKVRLLTDKMSKLVGVFCLLTAVFFSYGISLANTVSYKYDDLHRLTRVERSDGTVIVYQYDDVGNRSNKVVSVTASSLKALFSATPVSGTAPLSVTFKEHSTGTISSWQWNFGDSTTSTAQNPSHTYQNIGTYTVTLTVTGNGTSDTISSYINVQSIPIVDTDNDGIDDNWEIDLFGNLTTATATSDFDKDGYSDRQEYLNYNAGLLDPSGNAYDPKTINAPGGQGYTPPASGRVPDTGQTKCYNADGVEITCPSSGQPFYGQDAQYTYNMQSFTKLDENGIDLPDSAPLWAMIRDNVTGLIWENKTDDGSVHDKDNVYSWFDSNPATNGGNAGTSGTGTDTEDFIKALNNANFGGFSDWRLPTIHELTFIVDRSRFNSAINSEYFINTVPTWYWSSTTFTNYPAYAWSVNFSSGYDTGNGKNGSSCVRAVRGDQRSLGNYVVHDDGTVTDAVTGLMWRQETIDGLNWEQALAYSENSFAGYNDWRIPSIHELKSLVDYGRRNPSIEIAAFPDTDGSFYWSSTTHRNNANSAWSVNFFDGSLNYDSKSSVLSLRTVRNVQSVELPALILAAPLTGIVPLPVEFSCQPLGNVSSWLWNFGDGTTSTVQNPSHTYQNAGSYTVSLTVTCDGAPETIIKSSYITVKSSDIVDTDKDGIDDYWEIEHFESLTTATATSDFDNDGYSDRQEYLNQKAGLLDPSGKAFNPRSINYPGGTGYSSPYSWRVPDTGQSTCYDGVGNEIICPDSISQSLYGQDAQYVINPQSYTKLDSSGNDLPDSAASWVMIRDNINGLIWENKTDDTSTSIHGKYYYCANWQAAKDVIAQLNAEHFGGFSDWRLPTRAELFNIANKGNINPSIDTSYFPHTHTYYFTSSIVMNRENYVWQVLFSDGKEEQRLKTDGGMFRAVRGGNIPSSSHYSVNNDGTVTDLNTGLMWMQATAGKMTWEQSLSYFKNISFAGYNDWRLPNINELRSIVDCNRDSPAIDSNIFPDTVSAAYWSSTTATLEKFSAWEVNFNSGGAAYATKNWSWYIRPVRSGQNRIEDKLFIISPSQADKWSIGSQKTIYWEPRGIKGDVSISISYDGGKNYTTITNASPNTGSYQWTVNGPVSCNCLIKIEPLNDPSKSTVQGLFSLIEASNQISITATAGSGGSISPSGDVKVYSGTDQSFAINPGAGYSVTSIMVDGIPISTVPAHGGVYTFTNVTIPHSITAEFTLGTNTITATSGAGGKISPNGATVINYGADQSFIITPDIDYSVSRVLVDGVDISTIPVTGGIFTFANVTTAHTISAFFVSRYVDNGNGTVTDNATGLMWQKSSSGRYMNWQTAVTYCDDLDIGGYTDWRLPEINELSSLINNNFYPKINPLYFPGSSATFCSATRGTCPTDMMWGLNFDKGYSDCYGTNYGYYARAVRGGQSQLQGHLIILSPAQAEKLEIGSQKTITWNTQGISGDVSIAISYDGGLTYNSIAISTPNSGSYSWKVSGPASVNCMIKIEPLNDLSKGTVLGLFTLKEVNNLIAITASAGTGGVISPSGLITVNLGADQSFSITPNNDYILTKVLVDGIAISAIQASGCTHTFTNVTSAHTISASFIKTNTITATAGTGGTISPSGSTVINYGADQSFSITPSTDYTVYKILVDGEEVSTIPASGGVYTFTNVTSAHTISAYFASRYINNGNNTVTDTATGLMWDKYGSSTSIDWPSALTHCDDLVLGGYTDWRLPSVDELRSLLNGYYNSPKINQLFFKGADSSYWSSTFGTNDTSCRWTVNFHDGTSDCFPLNNYFAWSYFRAVRGGQSQLQGHLFILSPAQAEKLEIGSQKTITWNTQDISGNVSIAISYDGGLSYNSIAVSTPNSGSYAWTVTGPASVNCMIKIEPLNDPSKGTVLGLFTLTEGGYLNLTGYANTITEKVNHTIVAKSAQNSLVKRELSGIWFDSIRTWNESISQWSNTPLSSNAVILNYGKLDNDDEEDLIGVWPSGLYVRFSTSGQWVRLSQTLPVWITVGDLNNDGLDDVVGSWIDDGVYCRDSSNGKWMLIGSPAQQLSIGNIGGYDRDDLLGIWESGLWVRYSADATWQRIEAVPPASIAVACMTGNTRSDIIGSYEKGTCYLDSATSTWKYIAPPAEKLITSDIDGDGKEDLIGVWSDGVWVRYGKKGEWESISSSKPVCIFTTGVINGGYSADWLNDPLESDKGNAVVDKSNEGPGGAAFLPDTH